MATVYKVLGQINPSSSTMTTLYTVPAGTQTVISTISICNQAATTATFTIAVQPAGASILTKHYINYNTSVPANDTITLTLGITLATTDLIACSANSATVSFNAFGSEIS
jgi:hypothetical protein